MEDISNFQGRITVCRPESSFPHLDMAIQNWFYCELSGKPHYYASHDPPTNYFQNHTVPLLTTEGPDADYENDIFREPGLTLVYMTNLPLSEYHCQRMACVVDNDEQAVIFNIPRAGKRSCRIGRSERGWQYHRDGPEIWWDGLRMQLDHDGVCAAAESDSFSGLSSRSRAGEFSRLYRTVIRAVDRIVNGPSDQPDSS